MDELETEAVIKRDRERLTQAREEAEQRIQAAQQELNHVRFESSSSRGLGLGGPAPI